MSRKLTESQKKQVAADQKFRCANKPNSNLKGIGNYECPMWKLDGGNFDGSGYEIDHIIDHCISQDDSPENLQALCPSCHRRKTRNSSVNGKIKIIKKEAIDIDSKTKIIKKPIIEIDIDSETEVDSKTKKFLKNNKNTDLDVLVSDLSPKKLKDCECKFCVGYRSEDKDFLFSLNLYADCILDIYHNPKLAKKHGYELLETSSLGKYYDLLNDNWEFTKIETTADYCCILLDLIKICIKYLRESIKCLRESIKYPDNKHMCIYNPVKYYSKTERRKIVKCCQLMDDHIQENGSHYNNSTYLSRHIFYLIYVLFFYRLNILPYLPLLHNLITTVY